MEEKAQEIEELCLNAEKENREFELLARMIELENKSVERLRQAEEQLILQILQKLDDQTDTEANLTLFETSMAEGDFMEEDWSTILGKEVTGTALSVYQKLDSTIPYQTFKSTLLERLGYTDAKAKRTVGEFTRVTSCLPEAISLQSFVGSIV